MHDTEWHLGNCEFYIASGKSIKGETRLMRLRGREKQVETCKKKQNFSLYFEGNEKSVTGLTYKSDMIIILKNNSVGI